MKPCFYHAKAHENPTGRLYRFYHYSEGEMILGAKEIMSTLCVDVDTYHSQKSSSLVISYYDIEVVNRLNFNIVYRSGEDRCCVCYNVEHDLCLLEKSIKHNSYLFFGRNGVLKHGRREMTLELDKVTRDNTFVSTIFLGESVFLEDGRFILSKYILPDNKTVGWMRTSLKKLGTE